MTERITIDASAWTGCGEYTYDFRIALVPPRSLWRWWKKHLRTIPLPALSVSSGPCAWGDYRGFHVGFILCPWRDEGSIAWLVESETPYRQHTRTRLASL